MNQLKILKISFAAAAFIYCAATAAVAGEIPFNRLLLPSFNGQSKTDLLGVYSSPGIGAQPLLVNNYIYCIGPVQISIYSLSGSAFSLIGNYYMPDTAGLTPDQGADSVMNTGLRFPALDGNRMYMGNYGDLLIFDVTNPIAPRLLESRRGFFGSQYQQFTVQNNVLYHFASNNIVATDFSNPSEPRDLGAVPTTAQFFMSSIQNGRLLVCAGLPITYQLFNVNDPSNIQLEGQYTDTNRETWISAGLKGNVAYCALQGTSRLQVIDFSNPSSPALVKTISSSIVGNLIVAGNVLAGQGATGTMLYDISNPLNPVLASTIPLGGFLAASNSTLFLRNPTIRLIDPGAERLDAYNIANAKAPQKLASVSVQVTPVSPVIAGNFGPVVYLQGEILDFTDPANPFKVRTSSTLPNYFVGTNGYFLNGSSLLGYDLSDPRSPRLAKSVSLPSSNIRFIGDKCVSSTFVSGIAVGTIYDLSSASNLKQIARITNASSNMAFADSLILQVNGLNLEVYSSGSPAALIGSCTVTSDPTSMIGPIIVLNGFAYVPNSVRVEDTITQEFSWDRELIIVDFRNPAAPEVATTLICDEGLPSFNAGTFLDLLGNYLLYQASELGRFKYDYPYRAYLLDLADPAKPKLVSSSKEPDPVRFKEGLALGKQTLFDFSDPLSPRALGKLPISLDFNGGPVSIAHLGDIIVAPDNKHLVSLRISTNLSNIVDTFDNSDDKQWHRYDIFSALGQGTFSVVNNAYSFGTPPSPNVAIAQAVVGALRPENNFSDSRQQIDVTGWLNGPDDAPMIALEARTTTHPDATGNFYSANFSPTPFSKAAGTPLSTSANFAISKSIHFAGATLAITNFTDRAFDPAKTYRIIFEVTGNLLDATLLELSTNGPTTAAHIQATDPTLQEGYGGVFTMDKNGFIKVGNRPLQLTVDNYSATGMLAAPRLWLDGAGHLYFPIAASAYDLQSSGDFQTWSNYTGPLATDSLGLIKIANPLAKTENDFFRLKK